MHDAGEGGDDAPCDGDEGDPARGTELFEHEVGGEFGEDVGYEENGDGGLELRRVHLEVFFEAVEAGVADVDTSVVLAWREYNPMIIFDGWVRVFRVLGGRVTSDIELTDRES